MKKRLGMVPIERIENSIYLIRDEKVMLDRDLASLYGTQQKRLSRQSGVTSVVSQKILCLCSIGMNSRFGGHNL